MVLTVGRTLNALCLVLLVLNYRIERVDGANILGLFTTHSPSHLIVHMAVVKALAEKGHNLTVVSGLTIKDTYPNITHIVIPPTKEQEAARSAMISHNAAKKVSFINHVLNYLNTITLRVEMEVDIITNERFNDIYESSSNFDLMLLGDYFNTHALGVAFKLKCPVIMISSMPPNELVNNYVGNPTEIAYVPIFENYVKQGEIMNFGQRVKNFVNALTMKAINGIGYIINLRIYNRLFAGSEFPSFSDVKNNISLIFCNGHFSEGPIRPNVPAIIEIGGIQVKEQSESLPQDLAKFMNSSSHGTIFLSLGTNMHASFIKSVTVTAIFNVLSDLKQNIIWKWDDLENTPGKSPNIMYRKWLPQNDILAHSNLKLFITHAGKGSIIEAQYHGVPMVALPILFDQPPNALAMAVAGFGRQIPLVDINENSFRDAVSDVLSNSTYTENVRRFAQLYRDRPMTAKESVVYWAEYVIRHRGAPHLQSPFVKLNFIEAYNIDLIVFSFLVRIAIFKLLKYIFVSCKRTILEMRNAKSKND